MSSGVYVGLGGDPRSIRLVRLAPSSNFGHISLVARLIETTWDQCSYEALSYCWGKPDRTRTILLNGEQFGVTADLYDALQVLCLANSSRTLWVSDQTCPYKHQLLTFEFQIDAICINQQDTDEKSLQVQRMQDIYRNAERVLVWIGQARDHTEQAFKQAERLLACNDAADQKAIWSYPGEWIACLNEIIDRPIRDASYEDPPMGLFGLAYKLRHRQCTDSHDRLYAFLGLLKSTEAQSTQDFPVDYTMDVKKLWMTFAKATMSRYQTLLPLVLAENSRSVEARWCYNWSQKAYEPNEVLHERLMFWTGGLDNADFYPLQSIQHSAADGLPARIQVDIEAPSVISAQGFTISKVIKTGSSVSSILIGFGRPNYVQLFKEWESVVGGPWEDAEMTRRFAHTVTGGAWTTEPADWRAWNTKNHSEKVWSPSWLWDIASEVDLPRTGYEMSRHSEQEIDETHAGYSRVRDDACEARRIFLLENGEFGLGPESTKVGDQVVILLGSQVPLVLHKRDYSGIRRLADKEGKWKLYKSTWKLIGQAYVHSRMQYSGDLKDDINSGRVTLQDYLLD
ncbi:hypothetical protein FZEAL_10055 [Fusarium zealandicum]|uniref:Heterokaryon incompatibility domain-containing protein n=1 Tax=Fusarium zealandicum TaxID=1053134 RepID=A0A8H4U5V4_9HYPO|nr:hypothetical protein FZEAL_10055 [Fusarium zealandicum]